MYLPYRYLVSEELHRVCTRSFTLQYPANFPSTNIGPWSPLIISSGSASFSIGYSSSSSSCIWSIVFMRFMSLSCCCNEVSMFVSGALYSYHASFS